MRAGGTQLCDSSTKPQLSEKTEARIISPRTPPPHFSKHSQPQLNEAVVLDKRQADTTGRGSTDRLGYREPHGSNCVQLRDLASIA
jgi:hypothetical protein